MTRTTDPGSESGARDAGERDGTPREEEILELSRRLAHALNNSLASIRSQAELMSLEEQGSRMERELLTIQESVDECSELLAGWVESLVAGREEEEPAQRLEMILSPSYLRFLEAVAGASLPLEVAATPPGIPKLRKPGILRPLLVRMVLQARRILSGTGGRMAIDCEQGEGGAVSIRVEARPRNVEPLQGESESECPPGLLAAVREAGADLIERRGPDAWVLELRWPPEGMRED